MEVNARDKFLLSCSFEACAKVEQTDQCIWGYVEK